LVLFILMLRAPCTKLYQIDFERFRLFNSHLACFGVFKITDGLLLGDCASIKDLRFMLDNKVGLVVSFTGIEWTWQAAGIDYIVLDQSKELEAAKLIS
jgi:hypothetical protein